jgi:hypothetical protein
VSEAGREEPVEAEWPILLVVRVAIRLDDWFDYLLGQLAALFNWLVWAFVIAPVVILMTMIALVVGGPGYAMNWLYRTARRTHEMLNEEGIEGEEPPPPS